MKKFIYSYIVLFLSASSLLSAPIGTDSGFNSGNAKIVTFTGYGPNGMGIDGSNNIYLHSDKSNTGLAILKISSSLSMTQGPAKSFIAFIIYLP